MIFYKKNSDYEKLSAIIQQKIQENNDFILSKIEAVEERNPKFHIPWTI